MKGRVIEMNNECNCDCENNNCCEMKDLLSKYTADKSNLIQILNEVQEHYGYIPEFAQLEISEYLNVPMAERYGVVTFY